MLLNRRRQRGPDACLSNRRDGRRIDVEPKRPLRLSALSVEDLARIFDMLSRGKFDRADLDSAFAAGAPRNPDGTVDLVEFIAWHIHGEQLERERRSRTKARDRDADDQREPPGADAH